MKVKFRPIYTAFTAASLTLMTGCLEQGVVLNKPPAGIANTGGFTGNPARLASIELRVSQFVQLEQGQSAQLEVVAFDDQGNQIDPALLKLKWQAEDGSALSVDDQGRVTGLQPVSISQVTVTDTNSNLSDTGQVAVTGPFTGDPALLDRLFFAFANQSLLNQGDSVPFVLIAVDTQGRPIDPAKLGQINWAVSDPARFSIDDKGVVTALTSGQAATPAQVTATHAGSGKIAAGSVDMLRGGGQSGSGSPSPIPSAPEVSPTPSSVPSAAASPSAGPSAGPSVQPTATPTPSATPFPSANPSSDLPGDPAKLASLSISPSTRNLEDEGDQGAFFVQAVDSNGQYIDPARLSFSWSTSRTDLFKVAGNGRDALVTALRSSGFADIIVTETGSGKTATARITMGSSGGGGGGSRPSATPSPLGQYQVNSATLFNQSDPDVASDDEGNYVVVWESFGQDGDSVIDSNVYVQRYNSLGEPLGSEFRVNTYTDGDQFNPAVAMDDDGNFAVVYEEYNSVNYQSEIFVKYYNAGSDNNIRASEQRVNINTSFSQGEPSIAMDDDGDFVVVWQSERTNFSGYGYSDNSGYGIVARRYDLNASPTSSELYINTYITGEQTSPSVASDGDGSYVVVWESPDIYDGANLYGRRFDDTGSFFSVFRVNNQTTGTQQRPSIAMESNGDFVVAWQSSFDDFFGDGIVARRFGSNDLPIDTSFVVNSNISFAQQNPDISMDLDGDFVISWQSGATYVDDIRARLYNNSGVAPDDEFVVSDVTTLNQTTPAISLDDDGDFVIVWEKSANGGTTPDGSGSAVMGKNFDSDGEAK